MPETGTGTSLAVWLTAGVAVLVLAFAVFFWAKGRLLPGPHVLPELLGTLWAAALAVWIRKAMPAPEQPAEEAAT